MLLFCNADGSEKCERMGIWRSFRPHAFKKKTEKELGFEFHVNTNAVMTMVLCFSWIERFYRYGGEKKVAKWFFE